MRLEMFVPMQPPTITHQEKQVRIVKGKPIFYEPAELKAARQKLMSHLATYVPAQKYTCALRLLVKWCFPLDKSGRHRNGEYRTTRPDLDNLQKMLKDVMTKLGYWQDDALIACEIVEKFWAEKPGLYVAIEPLE